MDKTFLFWGVVLLLAVVAISGCTSQTQNTANTVNIQNMAFNPSTLNVKVGTTVTWVNRDSTAHDVVSDTGLFNSGNLNNGQSYSYTFNQAGSFPYHCGIHPSMTGTIVVSATAPVSSNNSSSSGGSSVGY